MAGIEIPIGAPLEQLTKDLKGAQTKLKDSIAGMNSDLKFFKDLQSKTFDPVKIAQYNKVIQTTQSEIKLLSNVGKTGFDEFGNSIAKTSNGLTKAFSGLRTLAYIIPGIGIAGIFNLAFEAITPLLSKLLAFNKELDRTAETQKELNSVSLKAEQDAQKEISSLSTLYRASQNHNLSLNERNKAVDLLQEKYPAYLKNFSDEEILAGKANGAYQKLKGTLIEIAYVRAAEGRVAEKASENLELYYNIAVKQAAIDRMRRQQASLLASNPNAPTESGLFLLDEDKINQLLKERDGLHKTIMINLSTILGLQKGIDKSVQDAGVDMFDLGKKTEKTGEKFKELNAQLKEAKEAFRQTLEQSPSQIGDPLASLSAHGTEKAIQQIKDYVAQFGVDAEQSLDITGKILPEGKLATRFEMFKETLQYDILPQLQSSFTTFFDDILMHGKLSFESLGKALISTFASVLASQATQGLVKLLSGGAAAGGGGGFLSGLLGAGGAAAAGSGGALLPILAGVAGIGLIASLFKKHKSAPLPAQSASVSASAVNSGAIGITGGQVVFEISGVNLVGVLNRAGQKLQRINVV